MPQELQLPDGRTLVLPDNMTLDQRTALQNKLGSQYADPRTGKGMMQRSQEQAKGITNRIIPENEAARRIGMPARTGVPPNANATNFNKPPGELNAVDQEKRLNEYNPGGQLLTASQAPMLRHPVVLGRGVIGSGIGAYGSGKLADRMQLGPGWKTGMQIGGGILGGGIGMGMGRNAIIDPATGEPAITPTAIAKRMFRTPEETNMLKTKLLTPQNNPYGPKPPMEDSPAWRDATKANEPFAGEEVMPGVGEVGGPPPPKVSKLPLGPPELPPPSPIKPQGKIYMNPFENAPPVSPRVGASSAAPGSPLSNEYTQLPQPTSPQQPFTLGQRISESQSPASVAKGTTGAAQEPFEPLIYESPQQVNELARRAANLKRQASASGMYSAAQGKVGKPLNYQQRIQGEFSPSLSQRISPSETPDLSQRTQSQSLLSPEEKDIMNRTRQGQPQEPHDE